MTASWLNTYGRCPSESVPARGRHELHRWRRSATLRILTPIPSPPGLESRRFGIASVALVLLVAVAAGCDRDPDTTYGTVRDKSLNGVSAFVQLLRDEGHRTATRSRLAERMVGKHDAAVVFADGFAAPSDDARKLIGRFLAADGEQTVMFVIRDSDAAIDYWRTIAAAPGLAADKARAARERLQEAEVRLRLHVKQTFEAGSDGHEPLAYGLAARERAVSEPIEVEVAGETAAAVSARWPLHRRLQPPPGARPVWTRDGEPLLVESEAGMSGDRLQEARDGDEEAVESLGHDRTMILASAAPLLNGGLVDPGNRRLARELVAHLPEDARVVVVGSAEVRSEKEDEQGPSAWRLLAVPPHPWIAAQAVLGMILFCWWRAPIFGRPRREDGRRPQDFGHHVEALAALLRRSRDEGFALRRLEAWRRLGGTTIREPPGDRGRTTEETTAWRR